MIHIKKKPARPAKKGKSIEKCRHDIYGTFEHAGKTWTILTTPCPLVGVYGYCDHVKKVIIIDGTISDAEFLNTFLHELSHVFDRRESEHRVLKRADLLAAGLLALGYKKK